MKGKNKGKYLHPKIFSFVLSIWLLQMAENFLCRYLYFYVVSYELQVSDDRYETENNQEKCNTAK
jgi:hypothetical protein